MLLWAECETVPSLNVLNLNEKKIKVTEKVKNEMNRLRREIFKVTLAIR